MFSGKMNIKTICQAMLTFPFAGTRQCEFEPVLKNLTQSFYGTSQITTQNVSWKRQKNKIPSAQD